MPEEMSDQERRERLARTVEVGRAEAPEVSVSELAAAVLAVFGEAVNAVATRLAASGGVHATLDEVTFGQRVRRKVGRALAWVVATFMSQVTGELVWDARKWRGEEPEAIADGTYGLTDPVYGAIVAEHVEALARSWSADLRRDVAKIVSEAASGGGVAEARHRLHDEVGLDEQRAKVIARTETLAARNAAAWRTYLRWGRRGDELQWDATLDAATRPSHAAAHGQRVAVGRPFVIGGHDGRWPGDWRLPAAERAQCRCRLVFATEDVAATVAAAGERRERVRSAMARLERAAAVSEARRELAALRAEVQAEAQRIGNRLGSRLALHCPSVQVVDLPADRIAAYQPAQDGEPEVILVDFVTVVTERGMLRRALVHELTHALVTRTRRVGPGGAVVASAGPDLDHADAFVYDAGRVARLLRLPPPTAAGAAQWPTSMRRA